MAGGLAGGKGVAAAGHFDFGFGKDTVGHGSSGPDGCPYDMAYPPRAFEVGCRPPEEGDSAGVTGPPPMRVAGGLSLG